MKRKIGLISIFVATVLILVGIFTIFASTSSTPPTLSIKGKNLSFSESIYIVFYVEAKDVDASNVKLLVWNSPQEDYTISSSPKKLSCVRLENIGGKNYLRFEYRDLAAKNMVDTIYARAYVSSESKDYYSELTNYSVLQYTYNKLGKTGTATEDEALKDLLNGMLEYGAAAQLQFDYKTDRLATADFKQITVTGGTLSDKCTRGFFIEGDTVVITANTPAEGKVFKGWKDSTGNIFSTKTSVEITIGSSNATYTAVFE